MGNGKLNATDEIQWEYDWVPTMCVISSKESVLDDLKNRADKYPFDAWSQVIRRLSYVGNLKKPISNKNYMYRIDKNYYECYIFGKKNKERLVFTFSVDDGITYIGILRVNDHDDVKKRKGMLKSDMYQTNDGDILTESDIDFLKFFACD